jgi:hypothetical protein
MKNIIHYFIICRKDNSNAKQLTSVGSYSEEFQRLHCYSNAEPKTQIDDLQQDAFNRAGISPRCINDNDTGRWDDVQ